MQILNAFSIYFAYCPFHRMIKCCFSNYLVFLEKRAEKRNITYVYNYVYTNIHKYVFFFSFIISMCKNEVKS